MSELQNAYEALILKAAQDEAFREQLQKDPKGTLEAHLGTSLPPNFKVNIVTNTATELTLVIPPKLTDELSDETLEAVAGGGKGDDVLFSFLTFGIGCAVSAAKDSVGACRQRADEAERKRPFLRP